MSSFATGNGASTHNGPPAVQWARELTGGRPVTSWTLTIGEDPR